MSGAAKKVVVLVSLFWLLGALGVNLFSLTQARPTTGAGPGSGWFKQPHLSLSMKMPENAAAGFANNFSALNTPTYPIFDVSSQGAKRVDIGSRMGVLVDEQRQLTVAQVMAAVLANDRDAHPGQRWQTIDRQSPNFGFTYSAHWFRFGINNKSGADIERLIELPIPFINEVHLYHFALGRLVTEHDLGSLKPFKERVIKHQNFVMPVKLLPGHNTILIRLASSGTVEAPFRLWEPVRFAEFNHDEKAAHGAIAGIMLVMILYNLFIYLTIRDTSYLFYIGFVASYLLFSFSLTGYTYNYLWPEAVQWNGVAIATFICSTGMFVNLFALSFLKLKETSRLAYQFELSLAAVCAAAALSTFVLPYHFTVRMGTVLSFISSVSALFLGYWLWWKGKSYARYYCLAWSAFLLGTVTLLCVKYGFVPSNFWTNNASQMGVLMLVVLLSVTLADQINLDRKLRIDAQAKALEHEMQARLAQEELIHSKDQANKLLEQRVEERTRDLHSTLDELKVANDRLLLLSSTDGLTQISNRAFFDKSLATEHRRAHRLSNALSIIIFDIDHFKRINDTYGHIGGDECLRALAKLMKSMVTRTGDVLARYGGEEFVVMLIDPDLEGSMAMAEKFRAAIEQLVVPFGDLDIRFTASFGVACLVPNEQITEKDILGLADKALYQAKQAGRNCVRSAGPA